MFDKNELRMMNRDLFLEALERYRGSRPSGHDGRPDLAVCTLRPQGRAVQVFVRKRPLKQEEVVKRREFDVATVLPGRPFPTRLVLHSCMFQADLKTPFVNHVEFEFDHVFGEEAHNNEVYRLAAFELVLNAKQGGAGTIFMFGQTGSGKTHTMTAIEEMAAESLFEGCDAGGGPWLSVQFVELRGNRCFDLLVSRSKDQQPELRLREGADGLFFADGATTLQPSSPQQLCAILLQAHARRATVATEANSVSSRSHALCTLRLLKTQGLLTLADCAGTERKKDSMYHSKERQQEGAEINSSLHALKECIRHLALRKEVPPQNLRASSLTKLLAGAFASQEAAKLAVICTVSPCASDTEHTLSTLRTGMALSGRGAEKEVREQISKSRGEEPLHPSKWDTSQVRDWLAEVGYRDVGEGLPQDFTGKMLVRVPESRFVQLCSGDERRGQQLFALLHERIRARRF